MKNTEYPKIVLVEAVVMANGEVIHYGHTLGFINDIQRNRLESGATKIAKGGEDIIAVGGNVA